VKEITLIQPSKLVIGQNCKRQFAKDIIALRHKNILIFVAEPIIVLMKDVFDELIGNGLSLYICDEIQNEPKISDVERILDQYNDCSIDCVAGIGGGSVMDTAKIVAAKINNSQTIHDIIGINNLKGRSIFLICIPTTSGTGSEVSPNAILLDEEDNLKKGLISPYFVPDAVYIDPALTLGLPPRLTAETGLDALCHCIEAYTNKYSHPIIDLYALKGIKLISGSLLNAVYNGNSISDRVNLSLGSYYGGLCLGPVNTAGVHALSYPLGGEFHITHGLANAMLLPHVFEFNSVADIPKHAKVAVALGVDSSLSEDEKVKQGIEKLKELNKRCKIPEKLTELGINISSIEKLSMMAMKVDRLLRNNPRELKLFDAESIYAKLF
jgi:alcohol dehydrogenase class IV